ncbi:arrestin domain containing protein [Holotrichia oblita]|uniref:Arrestin domain containing protein n=1 Tax=Holotrichia oblita TaxID=644536 RepID=A0ACB9SHA0_HOLOL|nr:arrestin domain containing protein [Holotrichia oblita]
MVQPGTGIIFDSPYNTYFAGATVTGRVQIVLNKPKKLRGILFEVSGCANVKWSEELTRQVDEDTVILPPGTHVYPFSIVLPPNLPSSFEGMYGTIRYIAKFTFERPWKFNQETKTAFTVVSPYDLNRFPNLLTPVKVQQEKYFCCGCCRSGPLTAVLMVPKTGYVCGERIPIIAEIDNASSYDISSITVKFQQFTSFYSQHPCRQVKTDVKVFERMKLGTVKLHESKSWNQMLLIPPLPPSSLGFCSIIDSEYQLFLEVTVGGFHISLKTTLPITIGTIPVTNENHLRDNASAPPDYDTAMGIPAGVSAPVPSFGENEAFSVKSIADDTDGDHSEAKGYTPSYPTYNFGYNG